MYCLNCGCSELRHTEEGDGECLTAGCGCGMLVDSSDVEPAEIEGLQWGEPPRGWQGGP